MKLPIHANDEVSALDSVILGIAEDIGEPSSNNPKSIYHQQQGTYPKQDDLLHEVGALLHALIANGIKVYRPENKKKLLQIFARDLGIVIGEKFFLSTMVNARKAEKDGIKYILDLIGEENIVRVPDDQQAVIKFEGGDVLLMGDKVFVGKSERTTQAGYEFLKKKLEGKKTVYQVPTVSDDKDYRKYVLHLDCTFQPIGNDYAIVYEPGISNPAAFYEMLDIRSENIFRVNEDQFIGMFPNIFSIAKDTVIIEKRFTELKKWLEERGFKVIEVPYGETSKLSGLLRCSTLPLFRK